MNNFNSIILINLTIITVCSNKYNKLTEQIYIDYIL